MPAGHGLLLLMVPAPRPSPACTCQPARDAWGRCLHTARCAAQPPTAPGAHILPSPSCQCLQALADYEDHPIVIKDIKKTYPGQDGQPPKLAVRSLNLAIEKGECFGLLGPNGAALDAAVLLLRWVMCGPGWRAYSAAGPVCCACTASELRSSGPCNMRASKHSTHMPARPGASIQAALSPCDSLCLSNAPRPPPPTPRLPTPSPPRAPIAGAGKSTSINMMVGLLEPSEGTAVIGGHDITAEMDAIYTLMGVCPQHDLLWDTLTGREHLLFYGRLKGLEGAWLACGVH